MRSVQSHDRYARPKLGLGVWKKYDNGINEMRHTPCTGRGRMADKNILRYENSFLTTPYREVFIAQNPLMGGIKDNFMCKKGPAGSWISVTVVAL